MEGFSLSMSSDSFNEEWMDLLDIVTKDREKDLEEKNLGELDFAGLYSIGTGHKGFERQPSYLEIFSDIESKDPFGDTQPALTHRQQLSRDSMSNSHTDFDCGVQIITFDA